MISRTETGVLYLITLYPQILQLLVHHHSCNLDLSLHVTVTLRNALRLPLLGDLKIALHLDTHSGCRSWGTLSKKHNLLFNRYI